jgi:hypothetical protein
MLYGPQEPFYFIRMATLKAYDSSTAKDMVLCSQIVATASYNCSQHAYNSN